MMHRMLWNVKVCSHRPGFGKPLVVMAILRLSTKEHSPLTHPLGMYSLLHTIHSRQSWVQGIRVQRRNRNAEAGRTAYPHT